MSKLTDIPNIGKTLAEKLEMVGIQNQKQLISEGAENAMIKISAIDQSACINMLYALEGAILGIRWHHLENERKRELTEFFNRLNK